MEQSITVGSKVFCKFKFTDEYRLCEILSERTSSKNSQKEYYVHYEDFNRRLDEWVTIDRVDLSRIQAPEPEKNEVKQTEKRIKTHKRTRMRTRRMEKDEEVKEEMPRVKNIEAIEFGNWEIETWYFSPYPKPYTNSEKLYICEFCLKPNLSKEMLERHQTKCTTRFPPGNEIYRKDSLSVFELDGKHSKIYCQNLCLLAKLFLDHKTLYYDVEPFLFYILCECDDKGCHICGYFSKEKNSSYDYNLACILTLPPYQQRGFGKLLISLSYELTKRERKVGSPEKPLSDLGFVSYISYWATIIFPMIKEKENESISIQEISEKTGITHEDITLTLKHFSLILYKNGQYFINLDDQLFQKYIQKKKEAILIDPNCLFWVPHGKTTTRIRK
ncbi:histone acetyltransferase [Anaeramoeba ignava]|uniref:Histone acetyltransferase n=1 Tax=Anaeramoeba ignava TaxID=1746090 RepID=A0A9Q0L9V7_ANAIG|nr:histone acetyltransferase [Anaeramoeba ignava]